MIKGGEDSHLFQKLLCSVLTLKLEAQIWQSVLSTSPGSVWACRLQLEELLQLQLVQSYWSSLIVLWQIVHHKTTKSCPRSSYTFTYFQKRGWRIKDVSTSHYPHEQEPWGGGQCSSMDHRFCVSKQGVGLSLTSPPLQAYSWRLHLKKGDIVTQMATSTAPRT